MTQPHAAALLATLAGPAGAGTIPAPPRTLVLVAHPDDETVGAGSRLPRLAHARFAYTTDGAPRDGEDAARHGRSPAEYRELRQRELHAALALCGIRFDRVLDLGYPDQQAAVHLAHLARRVMDLLATERIDAVLTHPYEGGHPDHDATAFAAHTAAALMRSRQHRRVKRGKYLPGRNRHPRIGQNRRQRR